MPTHQLGEATIQAFKASLRGQLIQPADVDYEFARRVYNGMIDKRPALIARCCDAADVMLAVNFARNQQLMLAVRGGGHNGGGLGTCEGGLVVDLAPMHGIRVDPTARTVRAEGGCTWGDVDHATHAFGLATPSGIVSSTGVGGLTLGGGIGHLTRQFGLTIDNLLEVDMVLADGSFVSANAEQNDDLFWAVRGGGGNFGVITSFLFRLHPIETVYAGPILWHMEQAADGPALLSRLYRYGRRGFQCLVCLYEGAAGRAVSRASSRQNDVRRRLLLHRPTGQWRKLFSRPLRRFGPPAVDFVGPVPYPALQGMFDALLPAGMQWYWRADFVNELSDQAIALNVKYAAQIPTLLSQMHLYPIDGAAHRPGNGDTAFSYRDARWAQVIVGVDRRSGQ